MNDALKKLIPMISLILLSHVYIFAQEQIGLRLDNYSGVSALATNPAGALATYPLSWEVNLAGFGLNIQNNLAYIQKGTIGKALRNINAIGPDPSLGISHNGTPALTYNFNDKNHFLAAVNARIESPSIYMRLKNGNSIGFFSSARAFLSSFNLPKILSPAEMNKIDFNQNFKVESFKVSGLVWSEMGVNYAHTFSENTEGGLTLGVSLKYLQGYQSFFLKNQGGTGLTQVARDTFRIDILKATFGYTSNFDENTISKPNGTGFGADIGAIMLIPADDNRPYQWRLGVSVVDMGKIAMTKNTSVNFFNTSESFILEKADFQNINTNENVLDVVLQKATTKNQKGEIGNAYKIALPTAIHLQADYAFSDKLFVNSYAVLRFPLGEIPLERNNLIAVTPRYESRWLGAAMPISLVNGKQLQMGLAARLAFLTLGTERLGSFLFPSKLTGTDFYIALKINPFQLNFLEKIGGGKSSSGNKKNVRCFKF